MGERKLVQSMGQLSTQPVVLAPAEKSLIGQRLVSLDAFRGATMALMVLVNTPGDGEHVYGPLRHAEWNGWTPTDVVFPSFMWIVGVALTLSLSQTHCRGGIARAASYADVSARAHSLCAGTAGLRIPQLQSVHAASARGFAAYRHLLFDRRGDLLIYRRPRPDHLDCFTARRVLAADGAGAGSWVRCRASGCRG